MCKAVVKRQDDERAPALINVHKRRCLLNIGSVVAVCEHNTFWIGSSTTGVSDCSDIIVHQRLTHREEFIKSMLCKEPVAHCKHLINMHLAFLQFPGIAKDNDLLHLGEFILYCTDFLELII